MMNHYEMKTWRMNQVYPKLFILCHFFFREFDGKTGPLIQNLR